MKYTIVKSGDLWDAFYADGVLIEEGSQINLKFLIKFFDLPVEIKQADVDWIEDLGNFPVDIKDVKYE